MSTSVSCQLCHKPVKLENARVNELGKAVHEECYVQALQMAGPSNPHNSHTPDSTP